MNTVFPSFRHNGSRIALVRDEERGDGAYIFVELETRGDAVVTDFSTMPYPSVNELIALCAEVATDANRLGDDSSIATARARLLPERLTIMSNWLVGVGRSITNEHDQHFEDLMDWFEEKGADAFPGERRILQLLMSGRMPGGYQIGSKCVHYDLQRGGFYALSKSRIWNAEELLHLVMLVLSDEYTVERYTDQGSPFLVVPLRELRPLLSDEQISLLAELSKGVKLATPSQDTPKQAEAIPDVPVSGGVLSQVIAAGQAAKPSEEEIATGFPDLRESLQEFRATHLT